MELPSLAIALPVAYLLLGVLVAAALRPYKADDTLFDRVAVLAVVVVAWPAVLIGTALADGAGPAPTPTSVSSVSEVDDRDDVDGAS